MQRAPGTRRAYLKGHAGFLQSQPLRLTCSLLLLEVSKKEQLLFAGKKG